MPQKTNPAVYIVGICLIVVLVIFGIAKLAPPLSDRQAAEQIPPSYNYSINFCDDAYETEKHHPEDIPYFDETLRDGCFSGFVTIPDRWASWRVQFLGNNHSDWMAWWYQGASTPVGPASYMQVMTSRQDAQNVSRALRLQGKGKIRFYKIN
jgi:hypothetical protein